MGVGEYQQFHRFPLFPGVVPAGLHGGESPGGDQLGLSEVVRLPGKQAGLPVSPHHAAVGALGGQPAGDIIIRVIGRPPGEGRAVRGHQGPGAFFNHRVPLREGRRFPDPRFTQVVPGGPGEIADHIGQFFHQRPAVADLLREVFRSQHHPVREHFVIPFIQVFHIVVADDVQSGGKGLRHLFPQVFRRFVPGVLGLVHPLRQLVVQAAPHGADSVADRPASVQAPDCLRQACRQDVSAVHAAALRNLVARGPDHHAGMAAVPAHKRGQVLLPVRREKLAVIPAALGGSPGVKGFVKNVHPQPVAGFDQRRGRRIVRGPDGVEPGFLQLPDLSFLRRVDGYRAQQPVVMVDAAALQLDRFPVDLQPPHRIRCNGPDPEQGFRLIRCFFLCLHEMGPHHAEVCHPGPDPVQVRVFRVPQPRLPDMEGNPCGLPAAGVDLHRLFPARGNLSVVFPHQEDLRLRQPVLRGIVPDPGFRFQEGISSCHFPGPGEDPVRLDMHPGAVQQPGAPVQPGSGVPPGIGLHARVDMDGDPVFRAEGDQVRQVHVKRRVAVVLRPCLAAVDLHRGVHHHPVKLQAHAFLLPLPGNLQGPGVIADPPGKVSHIRPGRGRRAHRGADHPVMGQPDHCPGIIPEHAEGIMESPPENPPVIHADLFHCVQPP